MMSFVSKHSYGCGSCCCCCCRHEFVVMVAIVVLVVEWVNFVVGTITLILFVLQTLDDSSITLNDEDNDANNYSYDSVYYRYYEI
jgi:hypothetical protein